MVMRNQQTGAGFSARHAYLLVDGSGSMNDKELATREEKCTAAARMTQNVITGLNAPVYTETYLSVYFYDAKSAANGQYIPRIEERLADYETFQGAYANNTDLSLWNPVRNHGGATPIGAALEFIAEKAKRWIEQADGTETRRALVYLISDGQNNVGDDGLAVRNQVEAFNRETKKGVLRLATIGYFQHPEGQNADEDAGRKLLKAIPQNSAAYFEAAEMEKILGYIMSTITVLD